MSAPGFKGRARRSLAEPAPLKLKQKTVGIVPWAKGDRQCTPARTPPTASAPVDAQSCPECDAMSRRRARRLPLATDRRAAQPHASPNIALAVYAHAFKRRDNATADAINDAINRSLTGGK